MRIRYTPALADWLRNFEEVNGFAVTQFSHYMIIEYETDKFIFTYMDEKQNWLVLPDHPGLIISVAQNILEIVRDEIVEYMKEMPPFEFNHGDALEMFENKREEMIAIGMGEIE